MLKTRVAGVLALMLWGCAQAPAAPAPEPRLVDLTHAFDADTIYWPTDEQGFVFERLSEGMTDGGYYYEAHRFSTAEHGGTHIDAPIHFHAGRWHVDEIPVERLVGPGVVVDVRGEVAADRDHRVGVAELQRWESRHGRIPEAALVLIRTGHAALWPDRGAYLGTELTGEAAVAELHFPGLHPDAAQWLVRERGVGAVGIDTASIDPGTSTSFETHRVLGEANVPVFENLAELGQLPPRGFTLVALPMKIRGGSGGPLRIVAILD